MSSWKVALSGADPADAAGLPLTVTCELLSAAASWAVSVRVLSVMNDEPPAGLGENEAETLGNGKPAGGRDTPSEIGPLEPLKRSIRTLSWRVPPCRRRNGKPWVS